MKDRHTAVVLIGFQNDYFSPEGALHGAVQGPETLRAVTKNTVTLINGLFDRPILIVSTPILFTPDYCELVNPVGILRTVMERRAFQSGTTGSRTIRELERFGDRIVEVPGKRGLNAFSNSAFERLLSSRSIRRLVLAGVVTSICIDSTGRAAYDKGLEVTVLSDCTSARTDFEQEFYRTQIFPLYARVMTHRELLKELRNEGEEAQPRRAANSDSISAH